MKCSQSPSKDPNVSPSRTPTDAVSRWKIPHYYRRSSNNHVTTPTETDTAASTKLERSNGNINIMNIPKKVQLDGPKKSKKKGTRSKYRKGEMVFVNFTVQDEKPLEATKKKSSKSRMLRIFSSSNDGYTPENRQLKLSPPLDPIVTASSTPTANSSSSTPSSATKRSYGSFLKYGRLTSSSSCASSPMTSISVPSPQEIVPRSAPLPNTHRPPVGRSMSANVALVNSNGRASLTMDMKPHMKTSGSTEKIDLLRKNFAHSNSNLEDDADENGDSIDHHYLDEYQYDYEDTTLTKTSTKEFHLHNTNNPSSSLSGNPGDENDASIAFSKMFTRKRANTGGSMSSMVSSSASSNIPTLHRDLSTNSVSSMSNRYSPVRAGSPARPRSGTRSSAHRLSRDLSSLYHSTNSTTTTANAAADLPLGAETFLDTQSKHRPSHKKKQDSISDLYKLHTSSFVSSNGTYSTAPIPSSTSSSSTPGTGEVSVHTGANRNNTLVSLERENSLENDVLEEEEFALPESSDLPAIKGIPRTTLEEEVEEEYDTVSVPNTSHSSGLMVSSMTNSVSTVNSIGASYQYVQGQGFTLVNTGLGSNDIQLNKYTKNVSSNKVENNTQKKQNEDLLDMYMEFDFENPGSFLNDAGQAHSENATLNMHEGGDASTVTSAMNISPTTMNIGNNTNSSSQEEVVGERTHHHPNHNFTNRLMQDIDQITESFNFLENEENSSSYW